MTVPRQPQPAQGPEKARREPDLPSQPPFARQSCHGPEPRCCQHSPLYASHATQSERKHDWEPSSRLEMLKGSRDSFDPSEGERQDKCLRSPGGAQSRTCMTMHLMKRLRDSGRSVACSCRKCLLLRELRLLGGGQGRRGHGVRGSRLIRAVFPFPVAGPWTRDRVCHVTPHNEWMLSIKEHGHQSRARPHTGSSHRHTHVGVETAQDESRAVLGSAQVEGVAVLQEGARSW